MALAGLLIAIPSGSAAAGGGGENVTIKATLAGNELFFKGPETVPASGKITIVSDTSSRMVGPHTFTLASPNVIPNSKGAFQKCFQKGRICRKVARAHEVDFQTGETGKPVIRKGKDGWDKAFSSDVIGDSFFAERKGDRLSQEVAVKPGRALNFFCAIHPEMHKRIQVTGG